MNATTLIPTPSEEPGKQLRIVLPGSEQSGKTNVARMIAMQTVYVCRSCLGNTKHDYGLCGKCLDIQGGW